MNGGEDERRNLKRPAPRGTMFRPHGRTEVWADGAIVHVLAEGPFNREGIDAFSFEMLALYRGLPPGVRIVNITEVRGAMLGTPDAWERLSEHLAQAGQLGLPLVGTAWVAAADLDGRSLMLPRAFEAFAQAGRGLEAFETMAEARLWARHLLAN